MEIIFLFLLLNCQRICEHTQKNIFFGTKTVHRTNSKRIFPRQGLWFLFNGCYTDMNEDVCLQRCAKILSIERLIVPLDDNRYYIVEIKIQFCWRYFSSFQQNKKRRKQAIQTNANEELNIYTNLDNCIDSFYAKITKLLNKYNKTIVHNRFIPEKANRIQDKIK